MNPAIMILMHSAAAAGADRARLREQEEEEMTSYTDADLAGEVEFKIVRSGWGRFRSSETLTHLVEEEARAGWVLLEKFDDYRVRFKRPVSARERDVMLPPGVDPYRTDYHNPLTFSIDRRKAFLTAMAVATLVVGVFWLLLG